LRNVQTAENRPCGAPTDLDAALAGGGLEHRVHKLGKAPERRVLNAASVLNAVGRGPNAVATGFLGPGRWSAVIQLFA
jgi:hypothetical protein